MPVQFLAESSIKLLFDFGILKREEETLMDSDKDDKKNLINGR